MTTGSETLAINGAWTSHVPVPSVVGSNSQSRIIHGFEALAINGAWTSHVPVPSAVGSNSQSRIIHSFIGNQTPSLHYACHKVRIGFAHHIMQRVVRYISPLLLDWHCSAGFCSSVVCELFVWRAHHANAYVVDEVVDGLFHGHGFVSPS